MLVIVNGRSQVKFSMVFAIIFALFISITNANPSIVQSLDGLWLGKSTRDSLEHEFQAAVPGGIYSDLMKAGIIDNIFIGYGDNSTKWVGNTNWTYALNFTVDAGLLRHEQINLVFEGVDTFATILVNGLVIGETNNMFVRYIFDVKDVLKTEVNNTVEVQLANAPEIGRKLNDEQLKKYKIPVECPPNVYRGECHVNMIRKMQASFSWDWGPSFPSMGIWKSVYLEAYDETVIRYVVARVEDVNSQWNIVVDTYFANNKKKTVNGTLDLKIAVDNDQSVSVLFPVAEVENENGDIVKSASITIDKNLVKQWWPNGHGYQFLYELTATLSIGDDVISKKTKIGFRTVELIEEPLGTGATFYFKVNGEPIFVKGSNEIPVNILPELGQDREAAHDLLRNAKLANMNMLRVWGGGVYESDSFYEMADELGIMIWQDFMFACSLYPANEGFLKSVITEVDHNVKRIYSHPSVVVYAGNNENEAALVQNWYNTKGNYDVYKKDYVTLYIDTVKSLFDKISGGTGIFVSSSPSNGNLTESQGWIGDNPTNQYWGDVHNYNYIMDPWASSSYPIPRFCSEYGYQSFPFEDSWLTAVNDTSDINMTGSFFDWRQHHPAGNLEIALLISENLRFPNVNDPSYTDAFIYLSQVYAAQAIKVETEHYRRYRSYFTDDGKGYTMGALYWQLNDVWVAPTWSSIDYTGRWKMLHYFAVNFFNNVIVTGHLTASRELQLYTVNDQFSPIENATVVIKLFKYDCPDFNPVYTNLLAVTLKASSSQLVTTIQTDDFLAQQGCDKNTCFFHYVIQKYNTDISPTNYLFPGKLKDANLPSAKVEIASVSQSSLDNPKAFLIEVSTDNIGLFVWLDAHSIRGRFSDNGFLLEEKSAKILFLSESYIGIDDLKNSLTVTHLKDPKYD